MIFIEKKLVTKCMIACLKRSALLQPPIAVPSPSYKNLHKNIWSKFLNAPRKTELLPPRQRQLQIDAEVKSFAISTLPHAMSSETCKLVCDNCVLGAAGIFLLSLAGLAATLLFVWAFSCGRHQRYCQLLTLPVEERGDRWAIVLCKFPNKEPRRWDLGWRYPTFRSDRQFLWAS